MAPHVAHTVVKPGEDKPRLAAKQPRLICYAQFFHFWSSTLMKLHLKIRYSCFLWQKCDRNICCGFVFLVLICIFHLLFLSFYLLCFGR